MPPKTNWQHKNCPRQAQKYLHLKVVAKNSRKLEISQILYSKVLWNATRDALKDSNAIPFDIYNYIRLNTEKLHKSKHINSYVYKLLVEIISSILTSNFFFSFLTKTSYT